MVDKVDRPEAPPSYAVTRSTETKRDKPQEEKRQEDLPTFKQKEEALYREKFQETSAPPKTFKVPLEEVKSFLFVRAIPRHGTPMADADLVWKDGKKLQGVSFLLKNWQDFMKIKNLKAGEVIPPSFWNYGGSHLEITVRGTTISGPWNLREIQEEGEGISPSKTQESWWLETGKALGIFNNETSQLKPLALGLYSLGILGILTLVVILFLGG